MQNWLICGNSKNYLHVNFSSFTVFLCSALQNLAASWHCLQNRYFAEQWRLWVCTYWLGRSPLGVYLLAGPAPPWVCTYSRGRSPLVVYLLAELLPPGGVPTREAAAPLLFGPFTELPQLPVLKKPSSGLFTHFLCTFTIKEWEPIRAVLLIWTIYMISNHYRPSENKSAISSQTKILIRFGPFWIGNGLMPCLL